MYLIRVDMLPRHLGCINLVRIAGEGRTVKRGAESFEVAFEGCEKEDEEVVSVDTVRRNGRRLSESVAVDRGECAGAGGIEESGELFHGGD